MRRILTWVLATLTVLVLLFSYHTSTSTRFAPAEQVSAAGGAGNQPPTPAGPTDRFGDVVGDTITTRFGAVQVQITLDRGRITAARALQAPNADRHDQMINARAVPILNAAVVAAQSAHIDLVSGATLTSEAYIQSLQSAIDKANQ